MTFRIKTFFAGLFFLSFFLMGEKATAQCDFSGQVIDLSNYNGCGKVILSYEDFELLVPVDGEMLDGIAIGTEVQFSFVPASVGQGCAIGVPVDLNCLELTSQPSTDCEADFNFAADFDNSYPSVTFQAFLFGDSLQYEWDFGDGEIANGPYVSHDYPTQGFYDVCLTVSGAACGSATKCQSVDLNECRAAFQYDGTDGLVNFYNASTGNYTDWAWSMGNGTEFQNTNLETYDYGEVNIYTVCLTVWNSNGCSSKYCDYVFTGSGDVCEFATCVYPGDTNNDGAANVYDLLPIGVGHGNEGPPRQVDDVELALDWVAQYAPDWGLETINGNDYKHIDCDGDGDIDGEDVEAIEVNYAAPSNVFMVQSGTAPVVWLDFEWDTILIDDATPTLIELEADLMVGTPDIPFEDLRGFALQMDYPDDKVVSGGIEIDYYDNSFFGNSNNIIWLQKDRFEDGGEFDLGFTKKTTFADGFGKIATIKFIVISDVLAREQTASEFTVTLEDIVAVNPDGAMLTIGDLMPATVHVVRKLTTDTHDEWLDSQVVVFPNPAGQQAVVHISELNAAYFEVYNSLGQMVHTERSVTEYNKLNVSNWESGLYLIKIQTDQGLVNKRLVVH